MKQDILNKTQLSKNQTLMFHLEVLSVFLAFSSLPKSVILGCINLTDILILWDLQKNKYYLKRL